MNATMRREILRFLLVGSITAGIDFLTYITLLYFSGVPSASKGLAFVVGTTCAYFMNRFWTFDAAQIETRTVPRFILVYAISLFVNVGVNETVLFLGAGLPGIITGAFVIATGISATMNFIGMKFIVFAPKSISQG